MARDPPHAAGPERQADKWQADEQKQQGVALLQPIRAQPSKGQ